MLAAASAVIFILLLLVLILGCCLCKMKFWCCYKLHSCCSNLFLSCHRKDQGIHDSKTACEIDSIILLLKRYSIILGYFLTQLFTELKLNLCPLVWTRACSTMNCMYPTTTKKVRPYKTNITCTGIIVKNII